MIEKLTCKSIRLEVTHACAADPGLADGIRVAVGFDPQWSKLDVLGYLLVYCAYLALTPTSAADQETRRAAFQDVQGVYNALHKLQEPYPTI